MKSLREIVATGLLLTALVAIAAPAQAAADASKSYPDHPIRYIVPFPPGGAVDAVARLMALKLGDRLHQSLIVENRAGAGGLLGTRMTAQAPGDGYTLVAESLSFLTFPVVFKDPGFDIIKDFQPISLISTYPMVLIVGPSVDAKSMHELITQMKANPTKFSIGSSAIGGGGDLSAELFRQMVDPGAMSIPYKGAAPLNIDLAGGRISMSFAHITSILPLIKGGQVRALAITSAKRSPVLPNVPTMVQSGYPDFVTGEIAAVLAPGKTPAWIVDKLNKEITAVLKEPDVSAQLRSQGAEINASSVDDFARYIRTESTKWAAVAKKSGLQPQ